MKSVDNPGVSARPHAQPGQRYKLTGATGVTATASRLSDISHQLPSGTPVLVAEVRHSDGRARISSPAGWLDSDLLEPISPARPCQRTLEQFRQNHLEIAPGDHYGLDFPISLDMVREFGPEFLTNAFRSAGTILPDNAVTQIVSIQPLDVPGASENAILTVSYAKAEPGIENDLFIKFPPKDVEFKYSLAHMAHGEVSMLHLGRERNLPVRVPFLYFGDYSSLTNNYILITERLRFGEGTIEPAYRKGFDHEVPDIEEHYRTLAKAMASLTAAHKTGLLGHDLESLFPFKGAARDYSFLEDPTPQIDRLIDFIGRIAPQLFITEASNPAFLKTFREDLLYGFAHKDDLLAYLHDKVDYTGMCHPNLNIDNAWFWRNAGGTLQAGLFDWAGAGQMSIAQAMSGMLMMQIPEKHISIVADVHRTYIDEYHRLGGPRLDFDELHFQYKASLFSTALYVIVAWVSDYFFERLTEEEYRDIANRFDDRIGQNGLYQGTVWNDCSLREWLQPVTPVDVSRSIVTRKAEGTGVDGIKSAIQEHEW